MPSTLPYDKTSKDSILSYARRLLGHSLRDLHPGATVNTGGRGGLGQAVEKFHFEYENNSDAEPDFSEAGLELKCSPLKELADGSAVAKERLVLNIINYLEEAGKNFTTSSFWKKNENLLLMFYLHESGVSRVDLIFRLVRNWSIPLADLKIFQDDWQTIHDKIASGHAHEIHEGDTFYLAACEKGSVAGAEMREQPMTDVKAQQRAYSIKKCYMDQIVLESLLHPEMISGIQISDKTRKAILRRRKTQEPIVKNVEEYQRGESFEELVVRRFRPYFGLTASQIAQRCSVEISSPKSMSYTLCRGMLGIKGREIIEFEKAGVLLKTIRLGHDGSLKESMSFSTIKYCQIAEEEKWEDSEWYEILTHKFFFVVFRKSYDDIDENARLEDVFFWSMPMADLNLAHEFWKDTRDKVRKGDYSHFIRSSEHPVCHVRPKAQNAADTMLTLQGRYEKKKCYWLNRTYVLSIVNKHLRYQRRFNPEILQEIGEELRYREYLPLYSQRAACGKFGNHEIVEPIGWVHVFGVTRRNENLYVVRASGHSMEPGIHDGEFCVFEFRSGHWDDNDIVLAECPMDFGDEPGGAYTIKKIEDVIAGGRRIGVRLVPHNHAYEPMDFGDEQGGGVNLKIVGVLRGEISID